MQSVAENPNQNVLRTATGSQPKQDESSESLGLIGTRQFAAGDFDAAIIAFRKALRLEPKSADLHHNLASALAHQGRLDDAIHHFLRSLDIRPTAAETCRNAALALARSKRWNEAEAMYRRALACDARHITARCELGVLLRVRKRPEEALGLFRELVRQDLDCFEASRQLAITLLELNRCEEAIECLTTVLARKPNLVEHLVCLGNAYEKCAKYEPAEDAYRKALALKPKWPEVLNDLGVVKAAQGRFDEAVECYENALELLPGKAWILNNLGNAHRSRGDLDRSLTALQEAVRLKPDYAEAHNNLGITWMQKGKPEEAIAEYERALYSSPGYAAPHLNRSLAYLTLADFEKGLLEYEWRWKGPLSKGPRYNKPRWYGEELNGATILLHAEQGLGDTLQFIRYAKLVKQRGGRVVAQIQKPLVPLLSRCPWIDRVTVAKEATPEDYRTHASMLSLPGIFRTDLESIPTEIPYLSADPSLLEKWREYLRPLVGLKIGIAWQGNPSYKGDRQRSVPLSAFAPLAQVPGLQFISLQKGHGTEQIAAAREISVLQIDRFDEEAGPFMDTAAILKNLDLLICSDSAIVHLAGALGVPTWLALPFNPDWRWFRNRDDSPWYPTMRLFRQETPEDWQGVFRRIAVELSAWAAQRRTSDDGRGSTAGCRDLLKGIEKLFREEKFEECIALCRQALEVQPTSALIRQNLGALLATTKQWSEAESLLKSAIEAAPQFPDAHGNLGLVYFQNRRYEDALKTFQDALRYGGGTAAIHNNIGLTLLELGRPAAALEAFDTALELQPDFTDAHVNRAKTLLHLGNYDQGWLELEWRWKQPGIKSPNARVPRWTGESLSGKTILLNAETHDEDTWQFIRYARPLAERGARVVVAAPKSATRLLTRCAGVSAVVAPGEIPSECDVQASLLSLPWIMRTTTSSVPAPVEFADIRRDERGGDNRRRGRLKVAVVCGDRNGPSPNFELERLRTVLASCDVEPMLIPGSAVDDVGQDDFDLANVLVGFDLVVGVDSPALHIAGSLGIPTLAVMSAASCRRWIHGRTETPWYSQMQILPTRGHSVASLHSYILNEVQAHARRNDRTSDGSDRSLSG